MKFILLWMVLTVFSSLGLSRESHLYLLSQYQNLQPFHQSIQKPVLDEKCRQRRKTGSHCTTNVVWKDDTSKHRDLVKETESQFDTEDPNFLSSHIGGQYLDLKNFLHTYDQFNRCSKEGGLWTEENLNRSLDRILSITAAPSINEPSAPACSENFLEERMDQIAPEGRLEDFALLESLRKNIESKIILAKKFKNQDPKKPAFKQELIEEFCIRPVKRQRIRGYGSRKILKNHCGEREKSRLENLIDLSVENFSQDIEFMNPQNIADSLNSGISSVNKILQDYNQRSKAVQAQWEEEDAEFQRKHGGSRHQMQRRLPRIREKRKKQLLSEKKKAFDAYRTELARLHLTGAGELFQTDAVKSKIKISELEDFEPQFFGLLGFEKAAEVHIGEFPLLEYIDQAAANHAVKEISARTADRAHEILNHQTEKFEYDQRYLQNLSTVDHEEDREKLLDEYKKNRIEKIEELFLTNPGIIGHILKRNPEYAEVLCRATQNIAADKRNRMIGEAVVYTTVGAGLTTAAVMTLGGALPITAMVAAAGVGVSFSVFDYGFQKTEVNKRKELHQKMLNSYFSGGGDGQSIDDIQKEWDEVLEMNYAVKVTLGLGMFDLLAVPSAAKAGAILRLSSKLDDFDHHLTSSRKLLQKISSNSQFTKTVHQLLTKYPRDDVGELLSFIGRLPVKQQNTMLTRLTELSKNNQLSPGHLMNRLVESDSVNKLLTKRQAQQLEDIIEDYDLEDLPKEQRRGFKLLSSQGYRNAVRALSRSEKLIIANAVILLTTQGKSQAEIMRSLANLLPIPDSLPSENIFSDK